MVVVVEPVLTEEKLRSLLAEAHEQPALDYKEQLDLSNRGQIVELAKDVAAMQSEPAGGYIVVGADNGGKVVNKVTSQQAALFDEATLRAKLRKYLAEPFDIRTATHTLDGSTVVVIYIAPNPEGWCIFTADGEYEVLRESGKLTKKVVFRVGEVFVRHGTASERWQDSDRQRLVSQLVARRKEQWRAELRNELIDTVDVGRSAQDIAQMPVSAVTWQLDSEGFEQLVTELMRRHDDVPLKNLLIRVRGDAANLLSSNLDEVTVLLDRVTSLAALAITYERSEWLYRSLNALVSIYELGVDQHGTQRRDIPSPQLWLEILAHVYALGGLAVRLQNWDAVRALADRSPRGRDLDYYGSWLRHGLTQAARAQVLDDEDKGRGLIERSHNVVRSVEVLRPDLGPEDERVLDSLCQFDALGALAVIGETGDTDDRNFYTNFARYYWERTEPAFVTVVTDSDARSVIFDGDDALLAAGIKAILQMAAKESQRYALWTGIQNEAVLRFLSEHDNKSS